MTEMDQNPAPVRIINLAMELQYYFETTQGVEDWCFMGICSRKAYEKLKASATTLTTPQTLEHMAAKLNG